MAGFLKAFSATLILFVGLLLITGAIFGVAFALGDQTTNLVLGGVGLFFVILAGVWLAIK
ncbi:MAG: hypothetical protein ACE5EW_01925 [Thermoplasmata archaeon]